MSVLEAARPLVPAGAPLLVPVSGGGEAVTALVEPHAGESVDEALLIAHVKEHLAGYKAPKRVLLVDTVGRAANGKLDYRALRTQAAAPDLSS